MPIKSKFIKNLIKGKSFSDKAYKKYISELVEIEDFILYGLRGMWGGSRYGDLKNKYAKEWEAIYKELKPKGFENFLANEKKEDQERKRLEAAERAEDNEKEQGAEREWLSLGGKK
jgi:hypothetical protein